MAVTWSATSSMRKFGLSPVGVRLISTSRPNEIRPKQGFGEDIKKKDAKTILEEEEKGIFRVLDIGKPRNMTAGGREDKWVRKSAKLQAKRGPDRYKEMKPDQDWNSVWPAARTFHPAVVPLPVRQGVTMLRTQVKPSKYANTELMKIPNFLHLTPPVIKKHCAAIKKFCTPFPPQLDSDEKIEKHFPVQVVTSTYLNSDSSIRDRRSRVVEYKFKLSSLDLDHHAKDKMIRLLGEKYDIDTDLVTLVSDRCPYRGQNLDYNKYLVTALFFESWRTESWEVDGTSREDMDNNVFVATEGPEDLKQSLETILNEGEDEETLRKYKEATRKLLGLPLEEIKAEVVQ